MKQICIVIILALGLNSAAFGGDDLFRGLLGAAVIVGTVDAMKHHRPVYGSGYGYSGYGGGFNGHMPWTPSYGYAPRRHRRYVQPMPSTYREYVPRRQFLGGCEDGYDSGPVLVPVRYRRVVTPCYRYGEVVAERIQYIPVYR
ncbi:MAG: hypothetical protein HZA95_02975 [Candidatus Vogelbacteria bacterium]|nr:hypothetical protein [Candidatus Vogelbacteria bacterium]